MMIGKTLVGRYRIDAELGRGGMGVVYRGFDVFLNRPVAIKVISSSNMGSEARSRLLAEARAVARLNHPNIVTVYDAIETDGIPFIVMELIEGGTLRSVPLPSVKQSIEFARQICAALGHAHERGIIHRDIKPDNVLISLNGVVKLMDFGLARSMDTPGVTDAGMLVGTFAYLAPELIQDGQPSASSDLYALGVVFYEMLTGDLPFRSKDIAQLFAELLRGNIAPPKTLNPEIPEMLNMLVLQLLSKNPQDRPESALAVEATLTILLADRAITQPYLIDMLTTPGLADLADLRAPARKEWDRDWRRKSYPKSSMPVLGPGEKEQVFSNRQKELTNGLAYLNDHRLLVLTGMPGIGKSTLARALLEFLPPETPPPFWYDFDRHKGSGNTLGVLLDRIAGYLERCLGGNVREEILSFRDTPSQQASAQDVDVMIDYLNQGSSLWLVFDNLETVLSRGSNQFLDEGLEMLFDGLKTISHNARIIITTPLVPRLSDGEYLLEFGTQPQTLQGLDEMAAINFLKANGVQGFADETLLPITRMVDGHPFALKHVSRYILTMGMAAALDNLRDGLDGFLEHFHALLLQRLSDDEIIALQQLTVLQRDISIAGLCKTAQARPALIERLREAGLLEKNQAGNFWLPALIRVSLQVEDPEVTHAAHLRAMAFYRSQKLTPAPAQVDDYGNVFEWHYHAIQAGETRSAYTALFSTGLGESLKKWNEYALLDHLCEQIRAGAPDGSTPLSTVERISLHHLMGVSHLYSLKFSESVSYFQTALQLMPTSAIDGDPLLRTKLLIDLADAQNNLGQVAQVEQICEQIFVILADHRDDLVFAKALHLRGITHRTQGRFEKAIRDFEEAHQIFENLMSYRNIAYVTGDLGIVYYYQNNFDDAIKNYRSALSVCEQAHDLRGVMLGHFNIGDVLLQQGDFAQAVEEFTLAFSLAQKKKMLKAEIGAGLYLVDAQIGCQVYEQAINNLDMINPLIISDGGPVFLGHACRMRAGLAWRQGLVDVAMDNFERAFELLKTQGCEYEQARAYYDYALFLRQLGQTKKAQAALAEARNGYKLLNNQLGLGSVEKALSDLENRPA